MTSLLSDARASVGARADWRGIAGCVGFVLVVLVGTALYSGQVWEDFLITFRHSKNLADGLGLVYEVGERVHGFTSPLNVLVPAIAYKLWPGRDYVFPLWVFSGLGLLVLATGLAVLLRNGGAGGWRIGCALFLVLQVKLVAFAMNGQEAAFWVGFLALSMAAAFRGMRGHWRLAGCAWAGLMWTRPDSPVYIAAVTVGGLLFMPEPRRQLAGIAKAALLTVLLYGPWVAWTWYYYGSPVPHTILAKAGTGPALASSLDGAGLFARAWLDALGGPFDPVYAQSGGWPGWWFGMTWALGLVCAFAWISSALDRLSRTASWVYFCGALYLAGVGTTGSVYPWYFPPLGLCGAIVLSRLAVAAWHSGTSRGLRCVLALCLASVMAALGWAEVLGIYHQQLRQRFIEQGVREPLGRWLATQLQRGDRVFLEPIGYIGYFSGAHVLDYPGLVSPAVVQARRAGARSYLQLIATLQPEWIVFRKAEWMVAAQSAAFAADYAPVAGFEADHQLLSWRGRPGGGYVLADGSFVVLHRRSRISAQAP